MADFIKNVNKVYSKLRKHLFVIVAMVLIMMCFCSCGLKVKFSTDYGKTSPTAEEIYADAGKYVDKDVEITGTVKHISETNDYGFLFVYFKGEDNIWRIRVHETNVSPERIYVGCKVWAKGKCEGATKNDDGTIEVHIYAEQFIQGN